MAAEEGVVKLLHVVGARPNFPKLAPVYRAGKRHGLQQVIVHTGQHYDESLSDSFFRDLGIPVPEVNLAVGSASHATQTARVMERIEPVIQQEVPDWVVVYGDVNSTMAAALVASKLMVRVAHVEAGLRSYDRSMPEEINRIVTDRLADLLLVPSRDAEEVLRREGESSKIVFVGNVMIDSLLHGLPRARATGFRARIGADGETVVVTLHRPSNVDDPDRLWALAQALNEIACSRKVVFPVHPRTRARLEAMQFAFERVTVINPISYFEMIDLVAGAFAVITDSGGVQEETTALGIPCLTVRENTERPITLTEGTNRLVPDPTALASEIEVLRAGGQIPLRRPEGWDGRAGERVVDALLRHNVVERPAGIRAIA